MVRVRVGFASLALGSAVMLAGCGGTDSPPVAQQQASSSAAVAPTSAPSVVSTTVAPPTTTVAPTTTPAVTTTLTDVHFERNESYYFTSPDGNFECAILKLPNRTEAGCEGVTTPVPPRPDDCMVNWGNGIRVTNEGEGAFMCSGGAVYTSGGASPDAVLPAGQPLTKLGFTCTTAAATVSCVNEQTTHGFTVAADSNEVF